MPRLELLAGKGSGGMSQELQDQLATLGVVWKCGDEIVKLARVDQPRFYREIYEGVKAFLI